MARGKTKNGSLRKKVKGRKALTITAEENVPLTQEGRKILKILKEGDG